MTPTVGRPPSGGLFQSTGLSAFSLYSILAVILTWPLALGITADVPGDLGDSLLNMWILRWGVTHLPLLLTGQIGWSEFWNANIFHPDPLAFALSEHLLGQTLQILPVYWLTGNIILCYNLLFISSFALSAFGTYLLVRDLTGDKRAAFIAGLVYGFLPYRIASVPHLQVMSSQWMPFALYGLNRFVTTGSTRALAGGIAAFVMQNWSCGYYLLYFAPFVPLFLIHRMWTLGTLRSVRNWTGLAIAAAGTLALTLPLLIPYRQAQERFGLERTLGEVYYFSANILSYFTASENVRLYGRVLRAFPSNEQEAFLGFMPWLLLLLAIVLSLRASLSTPREPSNLTMRRRALTWLLAFASAAQFFSLMSVILFGGFEVNIAGIPIRARTPARLTLQFLAAFGLFLAVSKRARVETVRMARLPIVMALVLTALAVYLSFGPKYGLYGMFYAYIPGFNGVRVPARYAMIAGLFLSLMAGFAAARILAGVAFGTRTRVALVVLSSFILVEGFALPIEINRTWSQNEAEPPARVMPYSAAPAVYQRIAQLPAGTAITEFPFGDAAWEIRYTYYAGAHLKPITNGYSGNFPPDYKERVARFQRVKDLAQPAWDALRASGTTHVVIHPSAFKDSHDADTVEHWLKRHGAIELERFPDGDILLKL